MPVSSPEKLFLSVIEKYKSGEYTKEQALKELEKEYKSALIDIKEELHDNFEIFCFHQYASCDIDAFIEACERSETSLSPSERDDFAQLISRAVQGVKKDCEDTMEKGKSYSLALQSVYNDVDEIRELCRKNRKTTELYEKYKVEIEGIPDTINRKSKAELKILKDLRDAGQINYENGEYTLNLSMPEFICWCSENGYIEVGDKKNKYKDDLTPNFIYKNIKNNCTIETIKRYFRDIKEDTKQ